MTIPEPNTMMVSEETVRDVLVDCPDVGHQLRPVIACFECPHFATVVDRDPGNTKGRPFYKRCAIGCRYPTARSLMQLYTEGGSDGGAE